MNEEELQSFFRYIDKHDKECSSFTNMKGQLVKEFTDLTEDQAEEILLSWILTRTEPITWIMNY